MHEPVLLNEVIEYLNPQPGQRFIDATINGGGHALAIIERIKPDGILMGLEWDPVIYRNFQPNTDQPQAEKRNLILINESYTKLTQETEKHNFNNIDGILFDLGMSSWHIEESGRGFSFMRDEPLDMRYNPTQTQETAAVIINKYPPEELEKIFKEYGEERFTRSIVKKIIEVRKQKPIIRTFELTEAIREAVPFWYQRSKIHYATRTFQALRIAVNHELENIKTGLKQALDVLKNGPNGTGGRLAVITFHSLEDRIIKNFFKQQAIEGKIKILTKKPLRASQAEMAENPRARSAKLRIAEKNHLEIEVISNNFQNKKLSERLS